MANDIAYKNALEALRAGNVRMAAAAEAEQESEHAGPSMTSFLAVFVIAAILDGLDIATLGVVSWLIPGIPGNFLIAGIMFFTKGWEGQLFGKTGLFLALECIPALCILPMRSGIVFYQNLDKFSAFLGGAAKVAKVAKYVVGPEAIPVQKGLELASRVTATAQAVKSRDLRAAAKEVGSIKRDFGREATSDRQKAA